MRLIEETTAGTTPANPAFLLFGKTTKRVKMLLDKDLKEAVDIGSVDVDDFFSAKNIYGVEVEWELDTLARWADFAARNADGSLKSYSLELIPNQDLAAKHYWRFLGWRPKSGKIVGKVGEAWMASVIFTGGKISDPVTTDPGIGTGSRQAKSAITDAKRTFASGAITYQGAALAILHDALELAFDHGTEAGYTTGNADPAMDGVSKKTRRFSGMANFVLEDGAKTHYDRVKAFTEGTTGFVIPFGAAGQPKLTLANVRFPKFEAEVVADMPRLMANQPFVSRGALTQGTV